MKPATSFRCTQGSAVPPGADWARATRLLQRPGEAVLAGLVQHHVEALAVAVGGVGPLAGLEVEAVLARSATSACAQHLLDADVERPVGVVAAGDALEPQRRAARVLALDLGLHVDVGQHAVRHNVVEPKVDEQVLQRQLDRRDGLGVAGDGIGAEHHVADGVGPAVEDLPADVVDVVGRRVRLNPRPQVALRADLAARQRVEDLRADRDQLLVASSASRRRRWRRWRGRA